MCAMIAFRDERLYPSAKKLQATEAEEPLRLGVDQDDLAIPVGYHDRIRRGLNHAAERRFSDFRGNLRFGRIGSVARLLVCWVCTPLGAASIGSWLRLVWHPGYRI